MFRQVLNAFAPRPRRALQTGLLAALLSIPAGQPLFAAAILGWNNLGMHCMDSDYSVFSILPPYNTIEAQLIVSGKLITNGTGYTVTYQAVADATGSINSYAAGKGNYHDYYNLLYTTNILSPEAGLAGWNMPGISNTPQSMLFEQTNQPVPGVFTKVNWWRAEGIPITPYDNAHRKNPYPQMRIIARNGANQVIATNDVVLPVSDEMDCRACHASGTPGAAAKPAAGWVWDGLPERDFRLNIVRLHDEHQFASNPALYVAALVNRGFSPQGLYRGVTANGQPVLCAACHASEALGLASYPGVKSLTAAVHGYHAHVMDPVSAKSLDDATSRSACYRCHPGSATRCLRGAMGGAIASDGTMEMQCQSCHGNMSQVGATNRIGWLMEPNCQGCHTGTATANSGQIRYTTVFTDTNGTVRVPASQMFATQSNTPAAGISLYRFSAGHGGLQCSACHGSTHAEFPSTHDNDNRRNIEIQGHAGVMIECTACHTSVSSTTTSGPHGMHPTGSSWISNHHDAIHNEAERQACRACHGADYRASVLSKVQRSAVYSVSLGTNNFSVNLYRGALVGCYTCHNGPSSSSANLAAAPVVSNLSTNTANDQPVAMNLPVSGSGAVARIISQPANGAVGLTNTTATYFPNPGFVGNDQFTFAAYDGSKNSLLATGYVAVAQGAYSLDLTPLVPPGCEAGWPAAFGVVPNVTNHAAAPAFDWDFGDGAPHSTNQFATHAYAQPGSYNWTVGCTVAGVSAQRSGTIAIGAPMILSANRSGNQVTFSWPGSQTDTLLEKAADLAVPAQWAWVGVEPATNASTHSITVPASGVGFYRLRRTW